MPMAGESSSPYRLSVHVGAKVPSRETPYKMIEASVTISSDDVDASDYNWDHATQDLIYHARRALTHAFVSVCDQMGEAPPDELRFDVEGIYGKEQADSIYMGSVGDTE